MALPTTITGISTAVACVGPFISSGGNVYFFGKDGTTATTLQAYKATDPTSSFSSVATQTTLASNTIGAIAGYQVDDVIHLAMSDVNSISSVDYFYITFNMATDAFVVGETVISAVDTRVSGGTDVEGCSIVVRSNGNAVIFFDGARVANMGNSYAQTYYSRRTGVNTWSAATQVSAGGTVDFVNPEVVLGTSDRVHFIHNQPSPGGAGVQRALSSGNALQTANTGLGGGADGQNCGISYNNAGTIKVVNLVGPTTAAALNSWPFDSADTPSITAQTFGSNANTLPLRVFNDSTDVWVLYRKNADSDLYVQKSTDNGSTYSGETLAFTATVAAVKSDLSIDGNIFTRGSSVVIPYVVNDNGTLKYNEYVVRSLAATFIAKSYISSQAVQRAAFW